LYIALSEITFETNNTKQDICKIYGAKMGGFIVAMPLIGVFAKATFYKSGRRWSFTFFYEV